MRRIKTCKKIYKDKPSLVYFIYESIDGKLNNKTYGYGKVIYPEGSYYEGNLFYENNQFHKYGLGTQYFKNSTINAEEFGGPKDTYIDRFVGMFNHLETNWICGDGVMYFVDKNDNPKAFIKGYFRMLNKVDEYKSKFDESILLPGYTLDMEVEQVLHQTRYEYLLNIVSKGVETDTLLLGDSWFELYEMPYHKNDNIYGTFNIDTVGKNVLNIGIGGSTYLEWINKVDSILCNIKFNKVIINLGFNDIHKLGLDADLDYIFNNLIKLEEKIRKYNADCMIYYLGVPPSLSYKFLEKKLEFTNMVMEYSNNNDSVEFISTKEIFLNGLEYKKDFKDMFIEGDGNHLNSYGYSKWSVLFKHIFK